MPDSGSNRALVAAVTATACATIGVLGVALFIATRRPAPLEEDVRDSWTPTRRARRRRSTDPNARSEDSAAQDGKWLRGKLQDLQEELPCTGPAPSMEEVIRRNSIVARHMDDIRPRDVPPAPTKQRLPVLLRCSRCSKKATRDSGWDWRSARRCLPWKGVRSLCSRRLRRAASETAYVRSSDWPRRWLY